MQNPINPAISGGTPTCRHTSTARRGRQGGRPPEPAAPLAAGLLPLVTEHPASSQIHKATWERDCPEMGKGMSHMHSLGGCWEQRLHSQCWPGSQAGLLPLLFSTPVNTVPCRIRHPTDGNVAFAVPRGPRPSGEALQQTVPPLCCCSKRKLN